MVNFIPEGKVLRMADYTHANARCRIALYN